MESHGNLPPFIPNPWDPPLPPPPNFQWGNPAFSGDVFPQFHPYHSPSDHSFVAGAGNFCPPKPNFPRKRKFDRADDGNFVKLYVAGVPRTVTEEEICHLFEAHGNVMEVVLLSDKRTGQNQEYCFVKYALVEEANRAITALHNQFTFPGAVLPITVRYADAAKQRRGLERPMQNELCLSRSGLMQKESPFSGPEIVGETLHKLYVNGLNREASKQEIEDIFSSYGIVADIYMMRDDSKQNRGCGFVGFTQRYMAVAAINGLNGSYVMKGCDRPLAVRFADPKKPKNGEFSNYSETTFCRPAPNPMDMRGNNVSNGLHLGNPSTSMQIHSTSIQADSCPTVANRLECPVSCETQKPLQQPISPSRFSQMSLQQSQPLQGSPQSSRQSGFELPIKRTSNSSIEQQHDHQPCRDTGSKSVMLISEPASCALSRSDMSEDPLDCDWSEHICPDGCKYYFNSATCESRWEKPEEFVLYEQQLQTRQLQNHSCQDTRASTLEAASIEEDCQIQAGQKQREPQLAMSCAVEHSHDKVQVENSAIGGPAFVQ